MGKGTKKKTVWRTFSFENGYTNGNDTNTNGFTASQNHQQNGSDSDQDSPGRSIINERYIPSWRARRYADHTINENDPHVKYLNTNDNVNECIENGAFYKPTPSINKYPNRENGLRKVSTYSQENGNKNDFHDVCDNRSTKQNQFRLNRSSKIPALYQSNHKKWDARNDHYNSNGILSNYNRNFRKSQQFVSNEITNNTNEHFNENCSAKNTYSDADDTDKCHDKANGGSLMAHHNMQLKSKFNEDEYTRISTPRSEVLFKKGYLMRDKKCVGLNNTAATSSNDSGSVSVISNEEIASVHSIQSNSPDNSIYLNGSSDSRSGTYPNDGFDHDLSLIYSSGFYDNSGYFYVNPYIQNNFDQFNGPTILMPYRNAPTTGDIDVIDSDAYIPASSTTIYAKSTDGGCADNYNSINSEEMSNSSLSENVSLNNDPDTPPNPLTPPPSPLSLSEKPIARVEVADSDSSVNENATHNEIEIDNLDDQKIIDTVSNVTESPESCASAEADAAVPDNYSMPYFSPLIFVPPIPFMSDARMPNSRRGKFRRHSSNHFGRPKRSNRFSNYYNKVYIPSNWSEAPEELAQNTKDVESEINITSTPSIEQCDKILQNSKLNLNVSEFIPQSKRMIFVPVPITPSPPASIYFVPIQSTESILNVNVPEFLPKNYKQSNNEKDETNDEKLTVMNDDENTITPNESTTSQSETINIQTNGLNNDTVCTQNALDNLQTTNNVLDSNPKDESKKSQIQTNLSALFNASDLLTHNNNNNNNNNNNINLGECIFNSGNSDKHIKADLGNKKITNNISKNNIFKNDGYCNDSGSNKRYKLKNSNKNAKTRHAYPKTAVKSQENAWNKLASNKPDQRTYKAQSKTDEPNRNVPGNENVIEKVVEKAVESSGLTYAQMLVPTNGAMQQSTQQQAVKMMAEPSKFPTKTKTINNATINGHATKVHKNKNSKQNKVESQEKFIEGAVEWFTIGAKGKKHIASDGRNTLTDIAFENDPYLQKVNKIAEELQLDINKDADLAMDIMDSLAIDEDRPEVQKASTAKELKKKKITSKSKKKSTKDKFTKESKQLNRDTFDIIEPSFESSTLSEEIAVEVVNVKHNKTGEHEKERAEATLPVELIQLDKTIDEFVFDPNVFATPCNLNNIQQLDSAHGMLGSSLRLSTGKPIRNLINQFDIYQSNYTTVENQQLQIEEEMVTKILQQLNKSIDTNEILHKDEDAEVILENEVQLHAQIEPMIEPKTVRENSVERFSINAKPYQNVYSSNHFLEHFFGDRNDKTDQIVESTNLSSSDQIRVETDENELHKHIDTYPTITSDNGEISLHQRNVNETGNDEISKCINEDQSHPQIEPEIENESQDVSELKVDCTTEREAQPNSEMEMNVEIKSKTDSKSEENIDEMSKTESFELEIKVSVENSLDTQIDEQSQENLDEQYELHLENKAIDVTCGRTHGNVQQNEINSDKLSNLVSNETKTAADDTNILNKFQIENSTISTQKNDDSMEDAKVEPLSLEMNASSIVSNAVPSASCNQSVDSNPNSGSRLWLRIVDTQMLAQQKKVQQSFPITTAVSMWLNQLQKEKTPEPIFRLPDRFFTATTKYKKQDSQTSHSNSSIDLTEDNTSISSDKFLINDDEEEDIMNFWESPTLLTPQTPTPPLVYNSLYGSSINYTNLLSNKSELLCNNIIDYDTANTKDSDQINAMPQMNINECGFNQNMKSMATDNTSSDGKCYRSPPEVCCTIM